MIEAIEYSTILEDIHRCEEAEDTIAILFANPSLLTGLEIINNIEYYHHRTGEKMNFYLPGYGAYWGENIPDKVDVCSVANTKWSFSTKKFVEFIESVEGVSKWEYLGESELMLIGYENGEIDYSKVLSFKLDEMLRSDTIPSINKFFENLFKQCVKRRDNGKLSNVLGNQKAIQLLIDDIIENLPMGIGFHLKELTHYTVKNYKR